MSDDEKRVYNQRRTEAFRYTNKNNIGKIDIFFKLLEIEKSWM